MKICLYLEFYNFLDGALFKKIGTGLLSSYKNQRAMLKYLDIPHSLHWDDSCDIFQTNTPWLKSIYLMKKAKRKGRKVIVWAHVTAEDSMQVFRFMPLVAPYFKKYLIYAYGLADLILAPTAYTKKLLLAYGLPEEKIAVQSNAVDLKKYYESDTEKSLGRRKYDMSGVTIGTMGLVIPRKGVDTFLALAAKFPENQFIWFGKIYSSVLVKPLPKNIPRNTRFAGYVENANEAYNALDIFIFPSYEENQGMAILEAAALGLPILVRALPAYEGWLIHDENCLMARSEDEFQRYLKLLIDDASLRRRLGGEARLLAEKESIERLSKKLLNEYQNLLAK